MKWLPRILLLLAAACGSSSPAPTTPTIGVFTAAPATVALGESTQLIFAASAGAKLTIDPGGIDVTGQNSLTVTPTADTTYTLTATSAGGTATKTAPVSVGASRSASFRVTPSGSATAGTEVGFTIVALDASGAVNPYYRGTVQFIIDDVQGTFPGELSFKAPDAGQITVRATFKTAGTRTFVVADKAVASAQGIARVAVAPAAAARLAISGVPASAIAGDLLAAAVTAFDPYGNVATGFAGTVQFSSSDATARLPPDFTFTAADAGTRTFTVVLTKAAASSISVSSAVLPKVTANIVVGHAPAVQVTLQGLPAQVAVSVAQSITVTVRDAFGNAVTDYTGTIQFKNTDPQATPIPDATFAATDLGSKVVTVQFGTAGAQALLATDPLRPLITGSATTQVTRGAAARLVLAGIPSSAVAGALLSATLTAVDANNNVVTDFTGTVHFSSTNPTDQLPSDVAFTAADAGSRTFALVLTKAGTSIVTVSSSGLTSAVATVAVLAGAARVTFAGLPAQVVVDAVQTLTVTVRDGPGNPVTNYVGTLHFTNSDAQASPIPDATFTAADLGARVVTVKFGTAGMQMISASDTGTPSIAGAAATLVQHGPAARLLLAGIPLSTVAGTPLTANVTVVDAHANVVTDFAGTVHVASTDLGAQLPPDFTFTPADAGSRAVAVVLKKAATSAITVTSGTLPPAAANVVVLHAGAAQVTLQGLPALVVIDTVQSVTVTVSDAFANAVTDYAGTLHFASSDKQASPIPDLAFVAANLGVQVVTVKFGTAGTQSLSASDTATASIAGSASTQVTHGAAVRLALTGIPSTAVAGALLTATVTAVDIHGNVVTDFPGTVHFASTDPNATLPSDTAFGVADAGGRSFSLALTTAGARSVSISQVGGTATGATANVTVANAPASRITLVAHLAQVAVDVNAVFTATIVDRFGNPALDYAGTVHFSSTDTSATTIANVTFTPALFATTDVTLQFATAGQQSLLASDTVNLAINSTAQILVTHGAAARLALAGIPPSAVAGAALTPAVTALDAHNNVVSDFAGTVHFASTDPGAQLPADFAFKPADVGSHTFAAVLTKAGPSSITVSSLGLPAVTTNIVVVHGSAAQLTLAGLPAQVAADVGQTLTVTVRDAFGNPATDYTGTVHFTSSDTQAPPILDATFAVADLGAKVVAVQFATAGGQSLSASDILRPSLAGFTSTQVLHGAAARLLLAGLPSSTVGGSPLTATVTAVDVHGNVVTDFAGLVHFSSSDPSATLPADVAFTAADAGSRAFAFVLTSAGSSTVTVGSPGLAPATATTFVVLGGSARVTLAGLPLQVVVDVVQSVTVTVLDASGNPNLGYTGTLHFTNSDAQAPAIPDAKFTAADRGVKIVTVQFGTAGTQTLSASDTLTPSLAGSASTQVKHGVATRLVLAGLPPSTVAGTLLTTTVTAVDVHGNVATDFAGLVHFASTDPNAQLSADSAFTAADLGSRTFPVVLKKAATSNITVSSGTLTATASVVVLHGGAAQVTLQGLGTLVVVDAIQSITVTVRDAFANAVTDYTGTIHFTSSDALASAIPDATFLAANLGAKVVTVQFGTAGTQSLSASDVATPSIAGSASTQVQHGAAVRLALVGIPSSTVAGVLLTPTVTAVDAHGNAVTDFSGIVHFASTDLNATLPADTAFVVADNGVRSFSATLITAGARSVSISQVGGPATGTTANIAVRNAPASRIALVAHLAQVAVDTSAAFTATILDRFGNPALDYVGTVHFSSSDPGATAIANVTFAPALFATTDVSLLFAAAGQQSLLASDTVNAALSATAPILVTHGAATRLVLAGLPSSTGAGALLTPTVTALDAHGNVATDFAGTVHFASTDTSAQLPADFIFKAADAGTHTFAAVLTKAATSSITVSSLGLPAVTTNVVVLHGGAAQLTLAGLPSQVVVDVSQNVTVTVRDAFGNTVTDYTGTLHFTNTDAPAIPIPNTTFTAADLGAKIVAVRFSTAGTQSLSANDTVTPSIAGSASTQVSHGAATRLLLAGLPPTTVAGSLLSATLTAVDAHGNVVTDFTGTVHVASSDLTAQLPADFAFTTADLGTRAVFVVLKQAATSSITVTSGVLPAVTASVIVLHGGAVQVTLQGLAPATPVVVDTVQSVTVTVRDSSGNAVTDYAGTIHFANTDPLASAIADTLFAAADRGAKLVTVQFGTAGSQTLSASDTVTSSIAGFASTQVKHGPATRLVLAGLPPSTTAGTLLTPTVTAVDVHGNVATDFAGTAHFTSTDLTAQLPADVVFTAADLGARAVSAVLKKAATSSITVGSGTLTAATTNVIVIHGGAVQLTLQGLPGQVVIDTLQSVTATVRDAFANTVTDYAGTIHFTNSDAQASLIPDATFGAADSGVKVVTVQFATAGAQLLSASDIVRASIAGSVPTQVLHGPALRLLLTGLPPSTSAGSPLSATVTAVDNRNNVVTDFAGLVHFSSTDATAQLPVDVAFTAADAGSRAFALVLTTAGTPTVTVSSTTLTAATATIVVGGGGGPRVSLAGLPAQVVVDASQSVTVTVLNASGSTNVSYTGTLHFTNSDAQASPILDAKFTPADAGVKVVTVQFGTAGTQTLSASDTLTPTLAGSASTQVKHGAAARLVLAGLSPSTVAGTLLTTTVTAVDAHGNVATDFPGTVHFTSTDAVAQLPADTAFTAADLGSRTFPAVLKKAGTSSITVASGALTVATASVVVRHAAATQVTLQGLLTSVGVDTPQSLTVAVRDAFANAVTDYAGTIHFTNTDALATPIPDTAFAAADLGARVVTLQFGTAGTQSLTASDTVTASITGSVSTQVQHGVAARLVLAGIPSSTVAGTLLNATVTVVDAHGNVVTDFAGTVHFASADLTAQLPADFVFTAADAGSRAGALLLTRAAASSITISSGALPATATSIVVLHGGAVQVTLQGLPAQVVVDAIQSVTVTVRDAFANAVTDYTGIIHFINSDAQAPTIPDTTLVAGAKVLTVQFGTAGTQSLSATDTVKPSITGAASTLVTHGAVTRLVLKGLPSSTVAGTVLVATVAAVDAHGNVAPDFIGTVHFASTDLTAQLPADFAFTAADAGSRAVGLVLTKAATSGISVSSPPLAAATANVVVLNGGAVQVTLQGLPALVVVDALQSVTVTVRDAFANTVTNYAGTLHFTNSDTFASAIPDTPFAAADLGAKTVTVQFGTAGPQLLSARDTLTPSITGSASTQVTHGAAVRLALTGIPVSTVAGALLTPKIAAVDAHGNVATDFAGTVRFASTDPNATLPADTVFGVADSGVRSFSIALATAGPRSVSISQVGGTATGATVNVTVANAPASRITLVAHVTQVAVDSNAVVTATILDRFGNPALDYTGTVHFSSTDPGATGTINVTFAPLLSATTDVTLQFATAGQQSFLASDTVNAALTASAPIKVINGPAVTYALSTLPTSALAGEPLPLTITALDVHGNPALTYAGSASVASLDPSDRLPVAGTFVNGVRTVSLAFVTVGQHHATVVEALGTIRVDTSTVTIVSGNASTLVVASGSTTAGAPTSTNVVAKDIYGNVVGSYTGTVTLTSTDAQATLPVAYTFTSLDAGQHTFSLTLKTAGTWSVTAADTANSISGLSNFSVAPAAATSCGLTVLNRAGTNVAVRVRVIDPFSNLATGYRNTIALTSSDGAAQLPPPATYTAVDAGSHDFTAVLPTGGSQTITATDLATPFSCQATVTSVGSSQFFAVTFSGTDAWAGTSRVATVQAQDPAGLPITNYAGKILFSSSDPAALLPASVTLVGTEGGRATVNVTFNTIGLQAFTAKDSIDATRTGSAFQVVHGLVYTDPATGGKVRLILNSAASTGSVVQLDLVSNTSLFPLGLADPQNGRVLPSTERNGVFAAGMNLPLDGTKVGLDTTPLVLPLPANLILSLGASPQAVGAVLLNGVLYSGISQKRLDPTLTCTGCTNDHMRGDVQVRPFPGATSLYYSLRLRLTPGVPPGTIFDGQALPANLKFRAAVRDRTGSDVFSGTADFAIGKLVVN